MNEKFLAIKAVKRLSSPLFFYFERHNIKHYESIEYACYVLISPNKKRIHIDVEKINEIALLFYEEASTNTQLQLFFSSMAECKYELPKNTSINWNYQNMTLKKFMKNFNLKFKRNN